MKHDLHNTVFKAHNALDEQVGQLPAFVRHEHIPYGVKLGEGRLQMLEVDLPGL